jgi:hypothetical protein
MKREIEINQTEAAALVRAMIDQAPWKDQLWSRAALMMAARAIERGRHLTGAERAGNLQRALLEETA